VKLGKKTIQISFDIEDDKPHKALRIYDTNGNALGYGEMVVKKTDPENTLFESKPGYIIYAASIDLDKMIQKEKEADNRKVKTVTKTEEPDVEDSGNEEEDNWVRGSLRQLKDAKVMITLTTVEELREQYHRIPRVKLGNSPRGVPNGIKSKLTVGDDFYSYPKEDFKQAELPESLKEAVDKAGDFILAEQKVRANATCYGDMPPDYIGDKVKEAEWEKQKAAERQELIDANTAKFQEQMEKNREQKETNISLDDL